MPKGTWIIDGVEYTDIEKVIAYITEWIGEEDYARALRRKYGEANICGILYNSANALSKVDPDQYEYGFEEYKTESRYQIQSQLVGMKYGDEITLYGTLVQFGDISDFD